MDNKPTNDSVGAMFLGDEPDAPEVAEQPVDEQTELFDEAAPEEMEVAQEDEAAEDAVEEEAPEDGAEFAEVEYDGRLYEVPLELKDAIMRNADYTQKTQELSGQRKQIEAMTQQYQQRMAEQEFLSSVSDERFEVQQLQATAKQYKDFLRDNIDNLSTTEIEKIRFQIQDVQDKQAEVTQSLQSKYQEFQQSQEQSHQELLKKGTEVLRSRIPGWNEEAQALVRQHALESGYTEQEIQGVVDPRMVETLWKAAQYDKLQASKGTAVKKVQGAPKIRPKARNPMPKDVQDDLNFRKKLKSNNLTSRQKQALAAEAIGNKWG